VRGDVVVILSSLRTRTVDDLGDVYCNVELYSRQRVDAARCL